MLRVWGPWFEVELVSSEASCAVFVSAQRRSLLSSAPEYSACIRLNIAQEDGPERGGKD